MTGFDPCCSPSIDTHKWLFSRFGFALRRSLFLQLPRRSLRLFDALASCTLSSLQGTSEMYGYKKSGTVWQRNFISIYGNDWSVCRPALVLVLPP